MCAARAVAVDAAGDVVTCCGRGSLRRTDGRGARRAVSTIRGTPHHLVPARLTFPREQAPRVPDVPSRSRLPSRPHDQRRRRRRGSSASRRVARTGSLCAPASASRVGSRCPKWRRTIASPGRAVSTVHRRASRRKDLIEDHLLHPGVPRHVWARRRAERARRSARCSTDDTELARRSARSREVGRWRRAGSTFGRRMAIDGVIYDLMPLSHLRSRDDGARSRVTMAHLVEAIVDSIEQRPYSGPVYDLEVDRAAQLRGERRARAQQHLQIPRRGHPQHPRVRAGVPRRHGDHARAELPVDADDPRRGERGHREQPRVASRRTSGPIRASAIRSCATTPTTRATRRSGSRTRSRCCTTRTIAGGATSPSSTARTRRAACSKSTSCASASRTRCSAAPASTTGVRSRTRSRTCGRSRTRPTR